MHGVDYAIVGVYLLALMATGLVLARKASGSSEDYFLAGRKTPWWALGASGMSSNLDAAGTMTILTLIYLYGLHGFWIEMRGGVVLPIAVFLAFMGKWHQRSKVVTTGEWMLLRFGEGWQGKAARYTAAATYLIITVGMVVFFLAAAGKFLAVFLPFDETTCAVAMAVIALAYTMISGLYGVIWTDVFQAFLIGAGAIYVSVLAFMFVTPELLEAWPGDLYNSIVPQFKNGLRDTTGGTYNRSMDEFRTPYELNESYSPFILFLLFWIGKGTLEGLGGSGGSAYMAQRFYAAKDEVTVKKLCMLWTVLFAFRWPMVLGFAILAIHLGIGQDDPEQILPGVLTSGLIPVGVTGLLVSAIFAASMSTFDSTINAGASYVVRDIVLPLKPKTTQRGQVIAGYLASIGIVAAGLTLALLFAEGVVDVWVTIVIQLFPAFLIPFALRWFWARFNGLGFTLGVAAGFAGAFALTFVDGPGDFGWGESFGVWVQNGVFTDVFILGSVGLCSLVGSFLGTCLAPPIDCDTLEDFYRQIKPFGAWPRAWKADDRSEHRGDVIRLGVALIWQAATFLLPMTLVLHMWTSAAVLATVWVLLGLYLLRDVKRESRLAEQG
ncbi:MAG: sodium:solute symporter [Planctomycetota bacterium]